MKLYDTIAAIATPIGTGGIAIIRISGPDAETVAQRAVHVKSGKPLSNLQSHLLTLADAHHADRPDETIDEILVAVMRAPHSYTGENVVEVNCHGGFFAAGLILDQLLLCGARMAEAGEFTRRAFMNGKTDLLEAEATIDIIDSHSRLGLQNAAKSLTGGLSAKVAAAREQVIALTSHISAAADYPDEVDELGRTELFEKLNQIKNTIQTLIDGFTTGRILKDGICTAIVGKPNVGKSSILNALARADRAIVTDIPGTTRDVIEEYINIQGASLRLLDTAGIRTGADEVESIGIERARENMRLAELCLFVIDSENGITEDDIHIAADLRDKNVLLILNKTDQGTIDRAEAQALLHIPEEAIIETATPKGAEAMGIDRLEQAIADKFLTGKVTAGEVYISNERQKDALIKARGALDRVFDAFDAGLPYDMLYVDLEDTLSALGEVDGVTVQEEIIDQVFSRFCVGK